MTDKNQFQIDQLSVGVWDRPTIRSVALWQTSGVRLISLQKNFGLEQLDSLPAGMTIEQLDSSGSDGFIDTAAVMACMDLVITSDTSIANLAGALDCRRGSCSNHFQTGAGWRPASRPRGFRR